MKRVSSLDELLPSFRPYVDMVLSALSEARLPYLVWETYRSPERALMLAGKGRGIVDSMHCQKCAVDILCGEHKWSCEPECEFYPEYGKIVAGIGLFWGGKFTSRYDPPHTQAVPATPHAQDAVRLLPTWEAKDAHIKRFLQTICRP